MMKEIKKQKKANRTIIEILIDNIKSIAIALIVAVIIRSFLVQSFYIPSGSMKPTLLEGDYVFVTKYNYGFTRYSLPFGLPLIPESRIFYSEPQRADVVIFKWKGDNSTDYVKRLIGLPGDKIQVINSVVYVNDVPLEREFLYKKTIDNIVFNYYRESQILKDGSKKSYIIRQIENFPYYDVKFYGPIRLKEDEFFMMGDNRDQSKDSRFSDVGVVNKSHLVGKGGIIFFSIDGSFLEFWKWFNGIRFERVFNIIR